MAKNQEEYHLPEEGTAPVSASPPPPDRGPEISPSPQGRVITFYKRLIVIIISLLLLWGFYRFYVEIRKAHKAKTQNITQLTPPVAIPMQSPPLQPAAQVATLKPTPAITSGLENRLANIEEGSAEVQAKIARSDATVADLQNSITTMAAQITALNNTLQDLAGQVMQQQAQIQIFMQGAKTARGHAQRMKTAASPPRKDYFIQALIPGRAWLISNHHTALTVRVGDPVPGYGVVNVIDPNQGIVLMSGGDVITFRSDEN